MRERNALLHFIFHYCLGWFSDIFYCQPETEWIAMNGEIETKKGSAEERETERACERAGKIRKNEFRKLRLPWHSQWIYSKESECLKSLSDTDTPRTCENI